MTLKPRHPFQHLAAPDSVFPPSEPSSLGSRPTPLVPASEELRKLGQRSRPPSMGPEPEEQASDLARQQRSEQVTVPDREPRPSSRPTASFGPAAGAGAPSSPPAAEQAFWSSNPAPDARSLPPEVPRRRPRSRARAILSKLLFATLFAGVAGLLGYAVKKKLDAGALKPAGALFAVSATR